MICVCNGILRCLKNLFNILQVEWQNLCGAKGPDKGKLMPPLPPRLLTDDDLKSFYEVMKISFDAPASSVLPDPGLKRKSGYLGGLDTQQYGRGKRAREVCLFLNISCWCVYGHYSDLWRIWDLYFLA